MKKLHIYNPSHEMAMADNSHNFQASKRVVLMEQQLAVLPVWWASDGDRILVPDGRAAEAWYGDMRKNIHLPQVEWVDAASFIPDDATEICPWGWNKSLWRKLPCIKQRKEVSEESLDIIRALSSRETAARVLASFPASDEWVGDAYFCTNEQQIDEAISRCSLYVLKALWSSSGRGVMMLQQPGLEQARQLCSSFLKHGGGLVIEPQYDKVQDFAMEFFCDGQGRVSFAGYSLFTAEYGRYAANIIAPQPDLQHRIQADERVLNAVKQHLEQELSAVLGTGYHGPLGVDMMVVRHGGRLKVHPCVEINLRRNMGWLAMTLSERFLIAGAKGRLISDYQKPGVIAARDAGFSFGRFEQGKLVSGRLSLTPVAADTQFQIYVQLDEE